MLRNSKKGRFRVQVGLLTVGRQGFRASYRRAVGCQRFRQFRV